MAEPQDPRKPKIPLSPGVPGAPLPRLWKYPSENDPEAEGDASGTKKKKKAKADPTGTESVPVKKARKKDDVSAKPLKKSKPKEGETGTRGVLIEETPELDTYETRQRVRIAVGVVLFSFVALTGFFIYRAFAPIIIIIVFYFIL